MESKSELAEKTPLMRLVRGIQDSNGISNQNKLKALTALHGYLMVPPVDCLFDHDFNENDIPHDILAFGFHWRRSNEGHEFWSLIHEELYYDDGN